MRYDQTTNTDLLVVTRNTPGEHDTPTTMYRDDVISRDRLQWGSPSNASRHTGAGERYRDRSSRVLSTALP